nr:14 kDa zinc-binding protein [Ipomoea batatas]
MATASSLSLLRGPLTVRALGFVRASNTRLPHSLPLFHRAIHYRRSYVSAATDEEASARLAAATADTGAPTILVRISVVYDYRALFKRFDKIIAKEILSTIVYEDDEVLAFRDINPQAPVHVLIIPKLRDGLTQLSKAEERHTEILGRLLYAAKIVAEKEGILDGFRVVINNGPQAYRKGTISVRSYDANGFKMSFVHLLLTGQSVYHLHLHGYRTAMPLSKVGLEAPAGAVRGQADDVQNETEELIRIKNYLFKELSEKTGQPIEKIQKDLSRLKHFDSQEALEYGLIDRIVRPSDFKDDSERKDSTVGLG